MKYCILSFLKYSLMIYLEFDELDDPVLFLGYAVFCALACFDVFAGSSETLSLTESSSNIYTMHAQSLTLPRAGPPPINSCPMIMEVMTLLPDNVPSKHSSTIAVLLPQKHKRRNNLVTLCQLRLSSRLLYFSSLSLKGQFFCFPPASLMNLKTKVASA